MKTKAYILLLLALSSLSSCNDWLTVNPKERSSEDDLFSTVRGCETALNGVYRQMAESSLYGDVLSFGVINAMSHTYDVSADDAMRSFKEAAGYQYQGENFKSVNEGVWTTAYNCIAGANNLLQALEKKTDDFFAEGLDQRNLMMGEALAIRAYIHFDLLRLYAPSPKLDDGGKYIPYVKVHPTKFPEKKKVKETLDQIVQDIQQARKLLVWDTTEIGAANFFNQWRVPATGAAANNTFYGYRAIRLNFYATTALLSRVLLYRDAPEYTDPEKLEGENAFSDREMAYKLAMSVIDNFGTPYDYESSYSISGSLDTRETIKMPNELIFALYNEKQGLAVESYYTSAASSYVLADFDDLYSNESDYRRKYFVYRTPKDQNLTNRWWDISRLPMENFTIPMFRLSELYYIAADAIFLADKPKALDLLSTAMSYRGLYAGLNPGMNQTEFTATLIREMRKEYAGEGKMFFEYKRLNEPVIVKKGETIHVGGKFTLPVPDSEFILKQSR